MFDATLTTMRNTFFDGVRSTVAIDFCNERMDVSVDCR
jgi:hypothetical protein